jgi:hypothetical protein
LKRTKFERELVSRSRFRSAVRHRWHFPNERTGHIILRDRATTGDGLLAGLVLFDAPTEAQARHEAERLAAVIAERLS